jgi:putative NADH-flavin reductase
MNILIFGATGGTGRHLVEKGLKSGHKVTAFVRNPLGLTVTSPNLKMVRGNILNPKDVENAINNQDAVISVLGNKTKNAIWKANTMISDGVRNIVLGMKKHKVRRLLFVASFGVNENIFLPEKLFIRIILKNIFADIPKQEDLIMQSGLDWTIVHPSRLIDAPGRGKYKTGEDLPIGLFSRISRSDVAEFLLKNIQKSVFICKTVTISY